MSLYRDAYKTGSMQGLTGDNLKKHIESFVADPPKDYHQTALQDARYGVFQQDLGEGGRATQRALSKVPLVRFVVPFFRTPVNIAKYIGERTPVLQAAHGQWRADFMAGGARRDAALAKTATGGMLMTLGYSLAMDGAITGGSDPKLRETEKLTGRRDYAVKAGDTYYQFNRFDPFGAFLGISADMHNISSHMSEYERDQLVGAAMTAFSRHFASKTFLRNLADFTVILNDQEGTKTNRLVRKFAGSFVPNAFRQVNQKEFDPEIKEIWDIMDEVKSRIPYFSKDVLPKRNIFGQVQKYDPAIGPDIVSPLFYSHEDTDPVKQEMARLQIPVSMPPKAIGGVDLDKDQYDKFVRLAGNELKAPAGMFKGMGLHEALDKLLTTPEYTKATDGLGVDYPGGKAFAVKSLITSYRALAINEMLQSDKEFAEKWKAEKIKKGEALAGTDLSNIPWPF